MKSFSKSIRMMFLKLRTKKRQEGEDLIAPFHGKIVSWMPSHYGISWVILGQFLFLCIFVTVLATRGSREFLLSPALFSLVFSVEGLAIVWVSKVMEKFSHSLYNFVDLEKQEVHDWYVKQLDKIFDTKSMIILGSSICVLGTSSVAYVTQWYKRTDIWFGNAPCEIAFTVLMVFVSFFLGAGLSVLFRSAVFVARISDLPIKISIYQHPQTSVKALGSMFFKLSLAAAGIYALYIVAILVSPFQLSVVAFIWMIGMGLVLIGYFIIPQYQVHDLMAMVKHQRIRDFAENLEKAFHDAIEQPTSENVARLKELIELQEHLNAMSEWPFSIQALWGLISAILIPIIITIMGVIFGK